MAALELQAQSESSKFLCGRVQAPRGEINCFHNVRAVAEGSAGHRGRRDPTIDRCFFSAQTADIFPSVEGGAQTHMFLFKSCFLMGRPLSVDRMSSKNFRNHKNVRIFGINESPESTHWLGCKRGFKVLVFFVTSIIFIRQTLGGSLSGVSKPSFVRKRKEKGGEKEDEVSERTPEPEGEVDRWDCNYFTKVVNLMKVITKYYETKLKRFRNLVASSFSFYLSPRNLIGNS